MKASGKENRDPSHRRERDAKTDRSKSNKPVVKQFKCNVCYKQTGFYMSDCGCFFCKDCHLDANSSADPDSTCIICNKRKTRTFDLRDRH
jgi:hypothetical protein